MIVNKNRFFSNSESGASIMEVLLAMAIIALAAPFVYNQISRTNHTIHNIAIAKKIISSRDTVLNFVRKNQDSWPDVAQIKMDITELSSISNDAVTGFIDKYPVRGAITTDVYLSFRPADTELKAKEIARHIGADAAVVANDGIAYGNTWAVSAPEFMEGDIIYRITRDIVGEDTSKFLHRATSGDEELNVMYRDLDMAHHHVYNAANVVAQNAEIKNASTSFITAETVKSDVIYFSSGANMNGENVSIKDVRVSGDISGFRNIYANDLNGKTYTTKGHIITDRATILDSVNVANDFTLKSDSSRSVSGFAGITASTVFTPYINSDEIIFYNNFGLTVSGELLMSTTSPIKFGNWIFPSTKPPVFRALNLTRATRPNMPQQGEFDLIIKSGWKTIPSITQQQTQISTID